MGWMEGGRVRGHDRDGSLRDNQRGRDICTYNVAAITRLIKKNASVKGSLHNPPLRISQREVLHDALELPQANFSPVLWLVLPKNFNAA